MSALGRAIGALVLLTAWRAGAVPWLLERQSRQRAVAPPAHGAPAGGQQDPNWTGPLGQLLSSEQRARGAELAAMLSPASPVPGADPELEPELLALTRVLLERVGVGAWTAQAVDVPAEGGDPWQGVEPRERLRLLRALVEADALDAATESLLLEAVLGHIQRVQVGTATI